MKHERTTHKDSPNVNKISDILTSLPNHFTNTKITIGEIKEALSERAYGILLLVLALPNLIPIPAPGLSTLLGVPLLLVTFQLMLGLKTPWLPNFIAKRSIKRDHLHAVCRRVTPWMQRLESVMMPRLMFFTAVPMNRLIALICVVLSLMIMMPIPFGNAFPALAICLFAVGIFQRDGLFIIAGLIITWISATVITTFLVGLWFSIMIFLGL